METLPGHRQNVPEGSPLPSLIRILSPCLPSFYSPRFYSLATCFGWPVFLPLTNECMKTGEGYFGDNCATVVVGGNSGTTTTTSSHISSNNSSINNSRNHDDHNSNSGGNSRIGDSGSSAVEWKWKKLENREESGGERLARATRESVAAA